jgi:hypothetical protein
MGGTLERPLSGTICFHHFRFLLIYLRVGFYYNPLIN